MKAREVLKIVGKHGLYGAVLALPIVIALYFDSTLSSRYHLVFIGICATMVALSDALFGQIIAQVSCIPFSPIHTVESLDGILNHFERFYAKIFCSWIVAKLASGCAIAIAVFFSIADKDGAGDYIVCANAAGYLVFGFSLCGVIYFLATYSKSRAESNAIRKAEFLAAKTPEQTTTTVSQENEFSFDEYHKNQSPPYNS